MPRGRLVKGDDAVDVEYELTEIWNGHLREIKGTLKHLNEPQGELLTAITEVGGAKLITESGDIYAIEFTDVLNGSQSEFVALPST